MIRAFFCQCHVSYLKKRKICLSWWILIKDLYDVHGRLLNADKSSYNESSASLRVNGGLNMMLECVEIL